jgi:hypothetical protein
MAPPQVLAALPVASPWIPAMDIQTEEAEEEDEEDDDDEEDDEEEEEEEEVSRVSLVRCRFHTVSGHSRFVRPSAGFTPVRPSAGFTPVRPNLLVPHLAAQQGFLPTLSAQMAAFTTLLGHRLNTC